MAAESGARELSVVPVSLMGGAVLFETLIETLAGSGAGPARDEAQPIRAEETPQPLLHHLTACR